MKRFFLFLSVLVFVGAGCAAGEQTLPVSEDKTEPQGVAVGEPNPSAPEVEQKMPTLEAPETAEQIVEMEKRVEETSTPTEETKPEEADAPTSFVFSGSKLAGNTSPLIDFNKADYDKALSEGRDVVLYFYATWCPLCRIEFMSTKSAFDEVSNANLVGFRVNYNDNDTDDDEKGLAREFGVAYQHTKVFLKNGERVLKAPDTWRKDRYLQEFEKHFAN